MSMSVPPRALSVDALDVVGVHHDVAEVAGERAAGRRAARPRRARCPPEPLNVIRSAPSPPSTMSLPSPGSQMNVVVAAASRSPVSLPWLPSTTSLPVAGEDRCRRRRRPSTVSLPAPPSTRQARSCRRRAPRRRRCRRRPARRLRSVSIASELRDRHRRHQAGDADRAGTAAPATVIGLGGSVPSTNDVSTTPSPVDAAESAGPVDVRARRHRSPPRSLTSTKSLPPRALRSTCSTSSVSITMLPRLRVNRSRPPLVSSSRTSRCRRSR